MEKNKSKQTGLFQSVASKISRFFKRDSSDPVPAPDPVPEPASEVALTPEPSPVAVEPQTAAAVVEAPVCPPEPDAPVEDEPFAAEEEKSAELVAAPLEEPAIDPEPAVAPEKVIAPQPEPEIQHHEPVAQHPEPSLRQSAPSRDAVPASAQEAIPAPAQEAAPAPKEPARPISIAALTSKRRLYISDLSRDESELLLSSYVQEHLSDEQLSVETMAVQLKISRTGLYQLVHDIFGVTPANYIMDCRLKYASEQLRSGRKVREVSSKCGFSDPKYFSKVFKKYYGVLPSNYGVAE